MANLTSAEFRNRFPFFDTTNDETIQAALREAHASYGGCAAYAQYHGIVGNHAAHILACEPGGQSMRLNKTDETTVYSAARDRLLRQVPRSGSVVA